MIRRALRRTGLGLLLLALAGCGFHLRGAGELPSQFSRTYLIGLPSRGALTVALEGALEANGVEVVDSAAEATAVLRFTRVSFDKRILSVGTDARVREYEYRLSADFNAHARDGSLELPEQHLQILRSLAYDPTNLLGKGHEEQRLRASMERDLVPLVLRRLQATAP